MLSHHLVPHPRGQHKIYPPCSFKCAFTVISVTDSDIGLVMMQDNHGEGGIFALLSLIPRVKPHLKTFFVAITLIGSSLCIGDGVITPAVSMLFSLMYLYLIVQISVLSAIEGIETQAPGLETAVVPITVVIVLIFFLLQFFGTSKIGQSFGPIMLVWFVTIAIWGIIEVCQASHRCCSC